MRIPRTILALTTLLLFAVMAIFGLSVSMAMDAHGNMASCPLMNGTASICHMDAMEHIGAWQSFSAAVMPDVILLFLTLTFLLIGTSYEVDEGSRREARNLSYNKNRNFIAKIFDPIHLAFRKGILHAKVYDYHLSAG